MLAATALLLCGGLLWWVLHDRTPPVPPHPLSAVPPASIVAVSEGGESLPKRSAAFRDAATLPSRLVSIPASAGAPINWASARTLRLATEAGLIIWLQIARDSESTWVRVNADALPDAGAKVQRQAARIKSLRLKAFRLPPPAPPAPAAEPHG